MNNIYQNMSKEKLIEIINNINIELDYTRQDLKKAKDDLEKVNTDLLKKEKELIYEYDQNIRLRKLLNQ